METPDLEIEAIAALGQWYERYQAQARSLKSLGPVFDLLEQMGVGRAYLAPGQYVIYGLQDPYDHRVRYIGLTSHPAQRAQEHLRDSSNWPKEAWIQRLRLHQRKPVMVELERCAGVEQARVRERAWIAAFERLGYALYNQEPARRQEADA